jgi:hypothetical protein
MPGSVQPDEQLEWERRAGRPAGVAAICGAVLLLASGVLSARGVETHAWDTYLNVDDDPGLVFLPNVVQAFAYLAVAFALYYLARATTARHDQTAAPTRVMAVVGPLAAAASAVLLAFAIVKIAHQVGDVQPPPSGNKARDDALKDLQTNSNLYTVASYVTLAARLAFAFALVLGSVNGMRAGTLSRFLGILGIILGVLSVLIGGFVTFVLAPFWLGAVGLIFLNRWPGGRGPAWDTVEAIPWPTAMDRQREALGEREAQLAAENAAPGDPDDEYEDDDEDEPVSGNGTGPADQPHPVSKKRKKRKRR